MTDSGEPDEAARDRILSERLWGELQTIRELVADVPAIKETVDQHTVELREMKGRLIVVEDVLRGHSKDIAELKTDVKELKTDVKEIKQIVGTQMETITELKAASHTHA